MQDSAPMILLVGQVGTDMTGREAFQELDYRAVFGSMAKWVVEVDRAERIPELLSRAWTTSLAGRPGPVIMALPEDMLTSLTGAPPLTGPIALHEPAPGQAAVGEAHALLDGAKRPLILVGGCNWTTEGRAALQAFAETSDIPVIVSFRAHDSFDNHSPCYAGEAGVGMPPHVKALIREADCILAVNLRFGEMTTDGYALLCVPDPAQRLIHVHGSEAELGKIYPR
jgi:acetolactate synthase I/II/III large subunit